MNGSGVGSMTDALTNPLAVVECGGNPGGFRGTPLWGRPRKFGETLKYGRGPQLESGVSPIPRQPPHSTTLSRLTALQDAGALAEPPSPSATVRPGPGSDYKRRRKL
ncbi:MAG TPA: hypothetical protein VMH30_09375 [Verrucomicrobiae bacterium]|nr:hypothetical protein [Verrucomicrobiae bacterium]